MSNTVIEKGKKMMSMSHQNQQRGPGNKNLGPTAARRPNEASTIRSMSKRGGKKGADHGAGTS